MNQLSRLMLRFIYIFLITVGLASCSKPLTDPVVFSASEKDNTLIEKITNEIKDLEKKTGKRFQGNSIKVHKPIKASYSDWRGMPVAKIRGNFQGGLTSWKMIDQQAAIYLAHADGYIPEWLIRHECLHVILLSNNITGHPNKYTKHFELPHQWSEGTEWTPNNKFTLSQREELIASCPICRKNDIK